MTKLIKMIFAVLVIGSFSQTAAQAGSKQLKLFGNGTVSIGISQHKSANSFQKIKPRIRLAQSSGRKISPSAALRAARRVVPGSQGLGVRYMPRRQGYVVTLKTRGRIRRVFVDARTGRVRR